MTHLVGTVRTIAADIKIAHSVFALPFAVLAAFMAAAPVAGGAAGGTGDATGAGGIDWTRFGGQLGLIVLAMVFARTIAMLANRLLDAEVDGRNPRTAGRAIPSGRLSWRAALVTLLGAALLFMAVCVGFGLLYGNWWPALLGVPVLAWVSLYALLKRWTALCHLYLGSSLALSPLAAALAVEPGALTGQPALWLLGGMVLTWVAGFDIIYALQDVDVDRAQGIHSVPARLGVTRGLWVSRLLHGVSAACLVAALLVDERLGPLFAAGVLVVIALLVWEHATVARWGTTRLALAFFTLNGAISCILGGLGALDVALG